MARIAVGGFQHETNTLRRSTPPGPILSAPTLGPASPWAELIDAVEGFNIPIAGAVKTLQELAHELVPLCWCSAPPSSYVERDAYEKVAGAILEDLASGEPLDGIYLDLHGAMVAEHHEDGEGELLRRIRALVGDRIPIVTSLDYHTNLTPEMVQHASAMIGYRTYPHIDMAATGSRAPAARPPAEGSPAAHKAYRQIDFLIPLVWQCTMAEPAKGIFALIEEIEQGSQRVGARGGIPGGSHNQGIVSITHTPGFPPADIAQCGPALVVYGLDRDAAEAAADRIAAAIREREAGFAGKLYTPDEAVVEAMRLAERASRPVLLADIQDNPGAGGTSDTVGLLRALIAHRATGAVIGMIVDPEAAEAATAAGEGALLDGGIGARSAMPGRLRSRRSGVSCASAMAALPAPARCSAAPNSRSARWRS
jgi:microcystin degradation protein MlrC